MRICPAQRHTQSDRGSPQAGRDDAEDGRVGASTAHRDVPGALPRLAGRTSVSPINVVMADHADAVLWGRWAANLPRHQRTSLSTLRADASTVARANMPAQST